MVLLLDTEVAVLLRWVDYYNGSGIFSRAIGFRLYGHACTTRENYNVTFSDVMNN